MPFPNAPDGMNLPGMWDQDPNLPPMPQGFDTHGAGWQGMPMMPMEMPQPMVQPVWPGMLPAEGEVPFETPLSGRMDARIPGTLEQANLHRLGVESQHAVMGGEINQLAMHEWNARPWMAYPFLAQRLTPSPALAALEEWYAVASQAGDPRMGDAFAQQWAVENPEMAALVRQEILALGRGLGDVQQVRTKTAEHLRSLKEDRAGLSSLEDNLRKGKEFIVDDFRNHPMTSVAVVVAGIMLYKMLKGTRAGKFLGIGAGVLVISTFLKDRYGIQIGEKAAQFAEGAFGKKAGDAVRNFRDTLRRPFVGPEGQGSAVGFLQERMGINSNEEKVVFPALIRQNPREFLAWYDTARMWQHAGVPATADLPPGLKKALSGPSVPTWFKSLTKSQRVEIVLRVADKMFGHIARSAPGIDPVAYVMTRYVEGTQFQDEYGQWHNSVMNAQPGDELYQMQMFDPTMRDIAGGFQKQTRNGAKSMDFLDILLMEMRDNDWNDLKTYNGAGWSANEVWKGTKAGATAAVEFGQDWVARPLINLFTTHIPSFWKNDVKPFMDRNGITQENFEKQFMKAYREAKAAGKDVVTFAEGTTVWRALKSMGILTFNQATRAWEMSADQAERLAVYLEWQRIEQRANAAKFQEWRQDVWDANASQLRPQVLPGGITVPPGRRGFLVNPNVPATRQMWDLLVEIRVIQDGLQTVQGPAGETVITISDADASRLNAWLIAVNSFLFTTAGQGASNGQAGGGLPNNVAGSGPAGGVNQPANAQTQPNIAGTHNKLSPERVQQLIGALQSRIDALGFTSVKLRPSGSHPGDIEICQADVNFNAAQPELIARTNADNLAVDIANAAQLQAMASATHQAYARWLRHFSTEQRRLDTNKNLFDARIPTTGEPAPPVDL
ncbi:MAG: hypothetical protein G01um101425_844 [Candidatus Peregrinibacteria bacterium Gr01-1014_25]|nr:MAG: hypothetical protein G01um101425_844 [Candidatus Peregrinibacteria bacterium Gr01-1014_25]